VSGETRIVRGALVWGAAIAVPAVGLAYLLRGSNGAVSVGIASGLVLTNAAAAAGLSALAGRISTIAAAMISLPSFAVRMLLIFLALVWLEGQPGIDRPAFALTFSIGVMLVILLEARGWKRTPWLATTFGPARTEMEDGS